MRRGMRRLTWRRASRLAAILALALALGALVLVRQPSEAQDNADAVARGRYLVDAVASCGHCHTPRRSAVEDMDMYLSGHPESARPPKFSMDLIRQGVLVSVAPTYTAFSGPWGVSFSTNLTPDVTGLGAWTEDTFVRAMRTGKHQGDPDKRDMLPPMPWRHYQGMTDADLRAIWRYLQTIPAISNAVSPAKNQFGKAYE